MLTTVVGYPRIGADRELKFWAESYFRGETAEAELLANAKGLRAKHWKAQEGLDLITSNDFSFYDGVLDTAVLIGAIPKRYKSSGLSELETYYAMARGRQDESVDVKALPMRKWFNTNYHYILPELESDVKLSLSGSKPFDEFSEAKALGIKTKPAIIGPLTFLKLSWYVGGKKAEDFAGEIASVYADILAKFDGLGAEWVQIDEPILVKDLTQEDIATFEKIYKEVLSKKGNVKVLLQTYFGDIRDCYKEVTALPFDGVGLDFVEGRKSLELVKANGFPKDKTLFTGVVNGKNIWRGNYKEKVNLIKELADYADNLALSTSCSLLHIPYTLDGETDIDERAKARLSFANEKLVELAELKSIAESSAPESEAAYAANAKIFADEIDRKNESVARELAALTDKDFERLPSVSERAKTQSEALNLPPLPTTTIGSYPQTKEVRENRRKFRAGELSAEGYYGKVKEFISACIAEQEEIGLDVLVHGEFERNDMVEYFGENLDGFLFTKKAWVQSYGMRCVKPPIIYKDVRREKAMTVDVISYAQSRTEKYVKGMLTGPATILNWSFPREDIPLKESAFQIGLAIRDEVLDLEAAGIRIIQVDEAAFREKLPLRKSDWHSEYLSWAVPAFRIVHSRLRPETQLHTHMCYSEFTDIIGDIDAMDADVISFEAARSNHEIVQAIKDSGFRAAVGPGVYDIHSPRIPSKEEILASINSILAKLPREKVWINPDCGLKTRENKEAWPSLKNIVAATKEARG